jgi:Ca2+-binding EF-hand superfamily protein
MLLLVGCGPDTADDDLDVGAEAAEAPPTTRPASTPFQSWDADQDQLLQREEFGTWAQDEGVFGDWLGDEGLDREAFNEKLVEMWDSNDDDAITQNEWQMGAENVYNMEYGSWTDWDLDGDGDLTQEEISAAHERLGFFEQLDADGDSMINDQDLGDWFFGIFDTNDNDALDGTEWDMGQGAWFENDAM